jgi:hypothetical protein
MKTATRTKKEPLRTLGQERIAFYFTFKWNTSGIRKIRSVVVQEILEVQ